MKAGILIRSLGMNQMSYQMTTQLNQISQLPDYWDISVFYNEYEPIIGTPFFACYQQIGVWTFDGPVMATDLTTAKILINALRPPKKYFYLWNLEWLYQPHAVAELQNVYCHPKLELIARSQEHADLISKLWKKPVAIIEDFNYEQLTQTLSR